MTTLLLSHSACLDHQPPMGHPERPDRLRAIEHALKEEQFNALVREDAPLAPLEAVTSCHPLEYAQAIQEASPQEGLIRLDADTSMSPGTHANAFVSTRPPGHHAETARPMGFCFFNNAAIAARHAQKQHNVEKVVI